MIRPRHLVALAAMVFTATIAAAQTAAATTTQVPDASQFVGRPETRPISGAELEKRTNEVSALLRCPVCQGLSVADSHADMAVNMKGQVRELLARGYSEEQILRYFEQSYGQFVLLEPKFEGVNALVWLLPLVAMIGGAAIVVVKLRRLAAEAPVATPVAMPPQEAEDAYLAQVRELARRGDS